MSKRRHSPSISSSNPPSKILHTLCNPDTSTNRIAPLTFDTALYDELILVIFSYLSYLDLCAIQSTNRNWARLVLDNQLWKALYLAEYGRTRLRGVRARKGYELGRNIKPLPQRVSSKTHEEDILDWKWLFKLGCNWRTGRCTVEQLNEPSNGDLISDDDSSVHILLAGSMIITASSSECLSPTIHLFSSTYHHTHTLHTITTGLSVPTRITALALDQSLPSSPNRHIRICSFLSTGEFSIFKIDNHSPSLSLRTLTYVPLLNTDRTSPISQAVYHHPVIITLSTTFKLSIYDLSQEDGVRHVQTLSSFSSYLPISIIISQFAGLAHALKVVLVYSVPVYPSDWSVGATELIISLGGGDESPTAERYPTVTSSRTARAFDVPPGWIDEHKLKLIREQWGRRVCRIADTQTDGKWVVLAPGTAPQTNSLSSDTSSNSSSSSSPSPQHRNATSFSNPLQLYRLSLPAHTSPNAPKLSFVRNLYGPEGEFDRIWVANGRCVSLGVDGSIWVWDLEERRDGGASPSSSSGNVWFEGAQVAGERYPGTGKGKGRGTIVFDDSRIVSAYHCVLEARRFDV